jgi:uncharacterized protein YbbK (DUF523 family)
MKDSQTRETLLISACLTGEPCRYDGKSKELAGWRALEEKYELVPVCPEQLGGLETPRDPSEIQGGRVVSRSGRDVTAEYEKGAQAALALAQANCCRLALLKEKSPSCGSGLVHNGLFDGGLVPGDGVTARLLKENGIAVYGESEIDKLL